MPSTVNLKAAGLYTSPNELDRVEGALTEADNVIIKRDGIIEQRRGFKLYGDALPASSYRVSQLTTYRARILRHYNNVLQYDSDGNGKFQSFAGFYLPAEISLRTKFAESNGNLYFTSSEGIKKISAKNATQFSTEEGYIKDAGAEKALDITGKVVYTPNLQSGFLPQDSAVAYRLVWNNKDANNVLITGTPSQREVVVNSMLSLQLKDFMRLLDVLDSLENSPATEARINDYDYVQTLKVDGNSSANDLHTNLISLAGKLDNDIFYADQGAVAPLQIASASITTGVCTITFSSGDPTLYLVPGSKIELSGFAPTTGELDGAQEVVSLTSTTLAFNTTAVGPVTITSGEIISNEFRSIPEPIEPAIPYVNNDLVAMQQYFEAILDTIAGLPTTVVSATDANKFDSVDITTSATVDLSFTIPQDIDSSYFYQVYRSATARATDATNIQDIVPNDELRLVYEAYPTPQELFDGVIEFEDVTPDDFLGENLYTNASTGEGILAANDQPPFAKDITRYKNTLFYANTRSKHRLSLNLLGVSQMIADYDLGNIPKITITNGDITNTYKFVVGQQEIFEIATVADVADSLHNKAFLLDTPSKKYAVVLQTSTATAPTFADRTNIIVNIVTNDSANNVAQKISNKLSVYLDDFIVSVAANVVEVICIEVGQAEDAEDVDTGFTITNTQQGVGERVQPRITKFTPVAGSQYVTTGTADYITINTALNQKRYVLWFKAGTATQPVVAGSIIIEIEVLGTETIPDMITKITNALPNEFYVESDSTTLTVENIQSGECDAATEVVTDAGFLVEEIQEGAIEVLLSPEVSPARAVDATARSLIRVINKNDKEAVYAFYLSGAFDVPGKIFLEARSLQELDAFYVLGNNDNTGASFNPNISPETSITSISSGANPVVVTAEPHGLENGDEAVIGSTDSEPSIDGLRRITYISPTSFSIQGLTLTSGGTTGALSRASATLTSENDQRANRVFYSKFQQPEAVPIVNYFDVGSEDAAILRILPLRDSLFVFKEDGLFRISGESAPFALELFDNSFILLAPDSLAVANNVMFGWTTQGIQQLTEGGSFVISRNIDNEILKLQSNNYKNFKTATWGIGYESDNSYLVFTVSKTVDTIATQAFRYSTLTESWTKYAKTNTCGVINGSNDKMYLGAGDVNFIEEERKSFDRTDFADREYPSSIGSGVILDNTMVLPLVTQFAVGDVIVQDQTITTYEFNTFLKKLDADPSIVDNDYYSTLQLVKGSNPRNSLEAVALKLDADANIFYSNFSADIGNYTGSITDIDAGVTTVNITSVGHNLKTGRVVRIFNSDCSPTIDGNYEVTVVDADNFTINAFVKVPGTTGSFETLVQDFNDLKACYNLIIEKLNVDDGVSFNNYALIDNNTIQEVIITDINRITRRVTYNLDLDFLVGDITVYKAIPSSFTYAPNTMGDPIGWKHLRESTLMFETRSITSAKLLFKTDLLPEFTPIPFDLDGNGIFGHFNFGNGFFGGASNSAPFRTFIPRNCQRCRYIVGRFEHSIAREDYRILGMTITGEVGQSSRAYR